MRLRSKLGWLFLLVPLLASGWGTVFAAAFCPHMAGVSKPLVDTADEDASCPAMQTMQTMHAKQEEPAQPEEPEMESHCSEDAEPAPAQHHAESEQNEPAAFAESVSPLGAPCTPCTHCLAPSTPVPAPLNLANDKSAKRVTDLLKPDNFRSVEIQLPIVPARVCSRGGAPPGNSIRAFILHSTFLI